MFLSTLIAFLTHLRYKSYLPSKQTIFLFTSSHAFCIIIIANHSIGLYAGGGGVRWFDTNHPRMPVSSMQLVYTNCMHCKVQTGPRFKRLLSLSLERAIARGSACESLPYQRVHLPKKINPQAHGLAMVTGLVLAWCFFFSETTPQCGIMMGITAQFHLHQVEVYIKAATLHTA